MNRQQNEAPRQGYHVTLYNELGEVCGGKFVTDREFDEEEETKVCDDSQKP